MSKKNRNKQVVQQVEETENIILATEESPVVEEQETATEVIPAEVQEIVEEATNEEVVEPVEKVAEDVPEEKEELPLEEEKPEVKEEVPVVEEKKEIKPVPNKGVLIVEKKTVAPVADKEVPAVVQKFNEFADKYIAIMGKDSIAEEDRRKGVFALAAMCQYVLASTDNRVFDACYNFFMKNRAIMLVQDRVTDGLYKYGDKAKVTKIVQWYVTFQSLVESKLLKTRYTLNVTTIRRTFNNDALANWLIIKKK